MNYRTPHEFNQLPANLLRAYEWKALTKLPFKKGHVSPTDYELVLAEHYDAKRLKSEGNKKGHEAEKGKGDLYDVYLDNIAWSVKSRQFPGLEFIPTSAQVTKGITKGERRPVDIHLFRCESKGFNDAKTDIEHGRVCIDELNKKIISTNKRFDDFRMLVILRSKDYQRHLFYEQRLEVEDAEDFDWSWNDAAEENLWGQHKHLKKRYHWQKKENQFTLTTELPPDGTYVESTIPGLIKNQSPQVASDKYLEVLRLVGYDSDHLDELKRLKQAGEI